MTSQQKWVHLNEPAIEAAVLLTTLHHSNSMQKTTAKPAKPTTPSVRVLRRGNGRKLRTSSRKSTSDKETVHTHLSDDDVRRVKKMEGNRLAARRCRLKKKMYIASLEQRLKELQRVHTALRAELKRLRTTASPR